MSIFLYINCGYRRVFLKRFLRTILIVSGTSNMLDRQINIKVEVKVQKDNRLHGNYCGGTRDKDDEDK